jgi:predicted RNA-binding protein with PIN domain
MPYIIDGHNLIGKLTSIDLKDPDDEEQLIRLLAKFMVTRDKRGTVFFDQASFGGKSRVRVGRLEVRFVRPPQDADEAIQKLLRKIKPQAANYIVVSSDHQVQDAASRVGARWMKSEEFAEMLSVGVDLPQSEDKPNTPLSSEELEEWERIFGSRKEDNPNL